MDQRIAGGSTGMTGDVAFSRFLIKQDLIAQKALVRSGGGWTINLQAGNLPWTEVGGVNLATNLQRDQVFPTEDAAVEAVYNAIYPAYTQKVAV